MGLVGIDRWGFRSNALVSTFNCSTASTEPPSEVRIASRCMRGAEHTPSVCRRLLVES